MLNKKELPRTLKTIGFIGGVSWKSSEVYSRILNERVNAELGGLHSAKSVTITLDLEEVNDLQDKGDWERIETIFIQTAQQIEAAGADCVVICANTYHVIAPKIQEQIKIPVLHIADAVIKECNRLGLATVGLLGTKFTMEKEFYRNRLEQGGLKVILPKEDQQNMLNNIINDELSHGNFFVPSRTWVIEIINYLETEGVQAIVLGCTELPLFINQTLIESRVPLLDTLGLHAEAAVQVALGF